MSTRNQPWCVILAGPNGAGKSTFYEQALKQDPMFQKAAYINPDDIAASLSESHNRSQKRQLLLGNIDNVEYKNSSNFLLDAGRISINLLDRKLIHGESFIYETTASSKYSIRRAKQARNLGFKVITIFIGLSSLKLSKARVMQRVSKGGHDIPVADLERRYDKIIQVVPELLKISDISAVFDNSGSASNKQGKNASFNLILLMDESKNFVFDNYPKWLRNSLKDRSHDKTVIPVNYRDNEGLKTKKTKGKIQDLWLNKEQFVNLPPEKSATLIRTIFDNFKTSNDR